VRRLNERFRSSVLANDAATAGRGRVNAMSAEVTDGAYHWLATVHQRD
jgi:hypothetical protein